MALSRILPNVATKYGAPYGRVSHDQSAEPLSVLRMTIDCQGYDAGGAYWGTGDNSMWVLTSDDLESISYVRSSTRASAIEQFVTQGYEEARIQPDAIDTENVDPGALPPVLSSFLEIGITMQHEDYLDNELGGEYDVDQMVPPSIADLDIIDIRKAAEICKAFLERAGSAVAEAYETGGYDELQMGYDLYMERVGSGVGFHDQDLPEHIAETLSASAGQGDIDLFVNRENTAPSVSP